MAVWFVTCPKLEKKNLLYVSYNSTLNKKKHLHIFEMRNVDVQVTHYTFEM